MCIWVALALVFCFGLYQYTGWQFGEVRAKRAALEFLTGYLVEESLSLDNMFVFVLVFAYFKIPAQFHHRVLFYGILGALVFRGIFIILGSALIQFGWVVILFGVFLVFAGLKMMLMREQRIEPEKSWSMRLIRKVVPVIRTWRGKTSLPASMANCMPRRYCWRSPRSKPLILFLPSIPCPLFSLSHRSRLSCTHQTFLPFSVCDRCIFYWLEPLDASTFCATAWRRS